MKFTIAKPKKLCLKKTFELIQKGKDNLLYKVEDNCLTSYISFQEHKILLTLTDDGTYVSAQLVDGFLPPNHQSGLAHRIIKFLGLDDPLLLSTMPSFIKNLNLSFGVSGYMSAYEALTQIILGQLLSVKAANSIKKAFIQGFGTCLLHQSKHYYAFPDPQKIAHVNISDLMQVGMSQAKSRSVIDISQKFAYENFSQQLNTTKNIKPLLLSIPGIGPWTCDWFILQELRHFDTVPSSDLVVRKAFSWFFNLPKIASIAEVEHFSKKNIHKGSFSYHIMRTYIFSLST